MKISSGMKQDKSMQIFMSNCHVKNVIHATFLNFHPTQLHFLHPLSYSWLSCQLNLTCRPCFFRSWLLNVNSPEPMRFCTKWTTWVTIDYTEDVDLPAATNHLHLVRQQLQRVFSILRLRLAIQMVQLARYFRQHFRRQYRTPIVNLDFR